MKRFLIALTALALAGCEVNEKTLQAGAQIALGVGAAAIAEINAAGIDPIQLGPEKLAKYHAGCQLAVAGSGLLTGDALTPQGAQLCELIRLALAGAPDAASELTPAVEKPAEG